MGQDIIVPNGLGALPSVWNDAPVSNDELSGGIVGGFGVLSYRTAKWRVKYRGNEELLRNADGELARSVELVLVRAAPTLSKVYYDGGWTEGSSSKPDCWSSNAVNPDPLVPAPVCASCGICPNNRFESRVNDAGKATKGKACGDYKRTAVVPLADMANEVYGGPMMLRIPAASLGDLDMYARQLKQAGYPYPGVATRIWFDENADYPKLLFKAIRVLTPEEAAYIKSLREDPKVLRILNEEPEGDATHESKGASENGLFEQPPVKPAPAPAPRPAPKPAPAPVASAPVAPAPAPKPAPAPAPAPRPAPAPAPKPAPVARPVSSIGAAVAAPVKAAPKAAPAAEPDEGEAGAPADFMAGLDAELASLLN